MKNLICVKAGRKVIIIDPISMKLLKQYIDKDDTKMPVIKDQLAELGINAEDEDVTIKHFLL